MASALLSALAWIPHWIRGRVVRGVAVRAVPALAVAFLSGAILLVAAAGSDLLVRMGTPTVYSIGFFVLTVLFAATAVAGAVLVARERVSRAGQVAWLLAALVTGANLLVLTSLGAHRLIGIRLWTY